jgi:hypothetical protein
MGEQALEIEALREPELPLPAATGRVAISSSGRP